MLDDVSIIDLYFGGGLPASQAFVAWKRIKKVYAEIAALTDRLESCSDACNSFMCSDIIKAMRQLSAV